ncbi:MAG: DegT/DnrJ/EryC1/StrS family aminotransferase [Polyangiaceae bacterium]
MQIVTFPQSLIEAYLADARRIMEAGLVAEGENYREAAQAYVPSKLSIPVASGGAAIFALLAYHKHVAGRKVAIVQSNTMRALYTVPSLLEMTPLVIDSTYDDFMSMSPAALERALQDKAVRSAAVVVYSVIGGYLAPSFGRIADVCAEAQVPLIIDGAHAHYLSAVASRPELDIAYSFYATKILPAGEGGLITTADEARHAWLRRFLMYDRFSNELPIGLNLRAGELGAVLIHRLMTDASLQRHFKDDRIAVAARYQAVCEEYRIRYLDPARAADYNGYKFVVLDSFERVQELGTVLTAHRPTSAVFDTDVRGGRTALPHWCPPTYSALVGQV